MSKPMVVTLPSVLLLLEKRPFFLLSAASCVVIYIAQEQGKTFEAIRLDPGNVAAQQNLKTISDLKRR